MKRILTQSAWVLIAVSLALGSTMNITAGDKDKDRDDAGHKITICHRGHTISVSKSALQAHLNHGDIVGPCEVTPHKNK